MGLFNLWNLTEGEQIRPLKTIMAEQGKLSDTPKWNPIRCGRGKQDKNRCQNCVENCPQHIYSGSFSRIPDHTSCEECGLCAADCPDRCIAPGISMAESYLLKEKEDGPLVIGCNAAGQFHSFCPAALSPEQLAYAALGDGLLLETADCSRCSYGQLARKHLQKLRFFLGEEAYAQKVKVSSEVEEKKQAGGYTRRELFHSFLDLPDAGIRDCIPRLEGGQEGGLFYAALLKDRIAKQAEGLEREKKKRYHVMLPQFTEACYNCGTCAWKCPQKALKLTNDEKNILVTVDAWRCSGCGICVSQCKVGGITGMGPMQVTGLGRTALKKIPVYLCEDCHKPRPKDSEEHVCGSCLAKRKMQRIREERARARGKAEEE